MRWVLWVGLLLLSTALRFVGPEWDAGIAAHPDERFLLGAASQHPLYTNICTAVPEFPYGHLPVTLGRLVALTAPEADPLFAARLGAGLIGVLLVAVSGACGSALAGWRGGLVGVAVAAFAPSLIQTAHFYTVDPFAALFVSVAVLAARRGHWRAAGALVGLAVACKASAAVALLPLLAAAVLVARWEETRTRAGLRRAVGVGAGALFAFAVASPWSLLTPVACWRGPIIQSLLVSGRYEVPYTQQYAGTLPYIYPLVQLGLWGLGPAAALLGLGGLGRGLWVGWRDGRRFWADSLAAGWTLLLFLSIGALHVKFSRYMLLLYPWWIAWAAYLCFGPVRHRPAAASKGSGEPAGKTKACAWVRGAALVLLLGVTALLGLAQASIYARPHPWMQASQWLYAHVPPGAVITVEAWDHPLPVPLGTDNVARFNQVTLPIFDEDGAGKAPALERALSEETLIVVASRRGYGALARYPERYAETLAWYGSLFASREAIVFARCPRLGPLAITDDPLRDAGFPQTLSLAQRCGTRYALRLPRLDESSRVYDAPFVLLFPH
jgi:hypothetical protein